jgi:ribosomal protein S2
MPLPSISKKYKKINLKDECEIGGECGKDFKRLMSFKGKKRKKPSEPGEKKYVEKYVPKPTPTVETEVVTGKVAGGAGGNFPGIAKTETYESTPIMNAAETEELEKTEKTKGRLTEYKLHKKKKTVTY